MSNKKEDLLRQSILLYTRAAKMFVTISRTKNNLPKTVHIGDHCQHVQRCLDVAKYLQSTVVEQKYYLEQLRIKRKNKEEVYKEGDSND